MRRRSEIDVFEGDVLIGWPWHEMGDEVDERRSKAFETISEQCRRHGLEMKEMGRKTRGHLLRFSDEQSGDHLRARNIEETHAGAVLWTENEDYPDRDDSVHLLSDGEIKLMERNSLAYQLTRLRTYHTPGSAAKLRADDPIHGLVTLLLAREAVWNDVDA